MDLVELLDAHTPSAWSGPMWNDCVTCNWTRRSDSRGYGLRWCLWCERDAKERMRTLAHNIAWAAQLKHSFHLGCIHGMTSMNKVCSQDPVGEFYPGCALDCPECELPRAKCICDEGRTDV